ncbi:hypothetical protein IF1G_10530 [Cordyceps javanica]|uniref:Uncharacterized protein n=1 Tax=Cordyceps javanica TaxID=43265 RepID=A0A545UMU2_9HYPO|nr:hypothetical protein IF1G_10530 [Cordyceps javanica]TQW02426.1 hypothetical protein IF2G_10026 [Cordyceps javanica]
MAVKKVSFHWEATDAPDSGLEDITFPMSMHKAPHETGYYFEQAIAFEDIPQEMDRDLVVYTGLQPRKDENGKSSVHAVFSSFFPGTTTTNNNCRDTANNGPGVSCAIDVQSSYDDEYHLHVKHVNQSTYIGTLIDHKSAQSWPMGSFVLPNGVGRMKGATGFVELHNESDYDCSEYPYTAVTFGTPFTSTKGVKISLNDPHRGKDCNDSMPWHATGLDDGMLEITIGKNGTSDNAIGETSASATAIKDTEARTLRRAVSREPLPPTRKRAHYPRQHGQAGNPSWDGPSPNPDWDGPSPNPSWDGPSSNPSWDGPSSNPSWDGPKPNPNWDGPKPNPDWDGPMQNPGMDGPMQNPGMDEPMQNPGMENPGMDGPMQNPGMENPGMDEPMQNPGMQNPGMQNPGMDESMQNPGMDEPMQNLSEDEPASSEELESEELDEPCPDDTDDE